MREIGVRRDSELQLGLLPLVVIVHKGRHGADLDRVGVISRVLKQTIIRVEQLPGNQEKELSGRSTVVQPVTHANMTEWHDYTRSLLKFPLATCN